MVGHLACWTELRPLTLYGLHWLVSGSDNTVGGVRVLCRYLRPWYCLYRTRFLHLIRDIILMILSRLP